jgi:subtilisin family serine protease
MPSRPRRARRSAVLSVAVLLLALTPVGTPAAPAAPAGAGGTDGPMVVDTHTVTLVTGDVVRLDELEDGADRAVVSEPAGSAWYQTFTEDGGAYVVPSQAIPLLAADRLDLALFNVSDLVEQGLGDATTGTLPLIVTYQRAATAGAAAAAPPDGVRGTLPLPSIDGLAVAADKQQSARLWADLTSSPGPGLAGLAVEDGIRKIWLDARVQVSLADSVPLIGAPAAWNRGLDGTGVRVAVLDTGVDGGHPDLRDRVVETRDFTGKGEVSDGYGHGTHVASIIAGSGAASDGHYRGVAPGAELVVGKVLDDSGSGFTSWVIDGMAWAAPRADIVNMSLGGPVTRGEDPVSQALNALSTEHGTLFVVAAGNRGPHQTQSHYVTSPAVASSALAVGASTGSGGVASFSRDKVMGSSAVKPELVAPGVSITAARAAGTGCCGEDMYTTESGTSMAAPHVAGAAAILAQQHPDWDPAVLKTELISTATPLESGSVYRQGAGRVDVDRATSQMVRVDAGVLDLGHFTRPFEDGELVTSRTLTYRNDGTGPATLRLTTELAREFGQEVPGEHLTVTPDQLTLAPGASTEVVVALDATDLPGNTYNTYSGSVVASGDQQVVRTAVGFVKEGNTVDVTVRALDRHGQPAFASLRVSQYKDFNNGGYFPEVFFLSPEQTEWTLRLPDNVYNVVAAVATFDESGRFAEEVSVVGDPELEVGPPAREVLLDARQANPLTVDTPRRSEPSAMLVTWARGSDTRNRFRIEAFQFFHTDGSLERVSVAPVPAVSSEPFHLLTSFETRMPALRAELRSPTGGLPVVVAGGPAVEGRHDLPVVDAGTARPEDLAGKDLEGALALVREAADRSWADQVLAVTAAGGSAMLLQSDHPGVFWPDLRGAPITVLSLDRDEGDELRRRLAHGPVTVRLHGTPATPYSYELTYAESGQIGTDLGYRAIHADLATVQVRLHRPGVGQPGEPGTEPGTWSRQTWFAACGCLTLPALDWAQPAAVRTEYATADADLAMVKDLVTPDFGFFKRFRSPVRVVHQPQTWTTEEWLRAPLVPGLPNSTVEPLSASVRFETSLRFQVAPWRDSAGHWSGDPAGLTTAARLYRLGEDQPIFDRPQLSGSVPVPSGPGEFRLEVDTDHDGSAVPLSTHTRTVWTFRSDAAGTFENPVMLPLVDVAVTDLVRGASGSAGALDLTNTAPDNRTVTLKLLAGHQRGADAAPVESMAVSVSMDDGASWIPAVVSRSAGPDGTYSARYRHPPVDQTSGYVSLRIEATDGDGNTMSQTIVRAYRLAGGV